MEFIYSALDFIANAAETLIYFIQSIPEWIKNCFEFGVIWCMSLWLDFKIASIQMALSIAQTLLSDYGVYTLIESNFNALPSDVRYILTKYSLTTGLRIIFDAFATSLVMRFMNW
ncbi:DUF2523 family protein [Vibrio sp. AND4]|uniref:DUF2523 family protein n=1 Tax=Vibrio sp. AND4 TaxID=314289 RepID=UPI00015F3129|nr:DUF2523 family protein [Vibrio sp. AND4]EDP60918.1 bacteriophage f237 ORF6 [Vibrio sp. AND4]